MLFGNSFWLLNDNLFYIKKLKINDILQLKEDIDWKEQATLHAPGRQQVYFLYLEEPMAQHTPGRLWPTKVNEWMRIGGGFYGSHRRYFHQISHGKKRFIEKGQSQTDEKRIRPDRSISYR
jgi:hypothetical protein